MADHSRVPSSGRSLVEPHLKIDRSETPSHTDALARALPNPADARLSGTSLDRKFLADAVAALKLHAPIDYAAKHFAGRELWRSTLGAEVLAAVAFHAPPTQPIAPRETRRPNPRASLSSLPLRQQFTERAALLS